MRHDVDGWAKLHQERLCLAYNLAKVKWTVQSLKINSAVTVRPDLYL